jgi:hypothetical protein
VPERQRASKLLRGCGGGGQSGHGLILSLEGLYQPPRSGRLRLEIELESELHDARLMDLGDCAKTRAR